MVSPTQALAVRIDEVLLIKGHFRAERAGQIQVRGKYLFLFYTYATSVGLLASVTGYVAKIKRQVFTKFEIDLHCSK